MALVQARAGHDRQERADADAFIALNQVSLVYGEGEGQTLAVDRLDMRIARGQFVAVVGPSGCGKSTLMKLISGLVLPSTGAVMVDGAEVRRPIRGVGMAFQNPLLMPWRNTLRNVMLPMEVVPALRTRLKQDRAGCEATARALLASVGLGDAAGKMPWQLSGGMQQRASLCRAMIGQPSIMILDEPFAALDTFTREGLWQAMQTLWMERGLTALLVTHDLREALFLADVIYVMGGRPGRILVRHEVDFPRPRRLDGEFDAACARPLAELRGLIAASQGGTA
jgi:NitT/TauT family transport system ATP-binding protein